MSLTGGVASPYALLLPAGVALSWHGEGRPAARFFAAAALFGCAALVVLGRAPLSGTALFPVVGLALAAPALLVTLEVADRSPRTDAIPETAPVADARAAPAPAPAVQPAPPRSVEPVRDREAEILHDLRSPLSVIRVYTDLIQEAARRGELPNPDYLANLAREIDLAERLVGVPAPAPDTVERLEPPQNANLVEILGSLATAYRLAHGGRIRIEFIAERPQLPVAAEPVALQRAFRNVLDNAIKYTPDGGEVRIRAGAAGPHAFVVVKDTGMGMSPEERTRAFDYAFRGAGAVASGTRGKGLGLAVTKEILESNGGKISLSSEAGYGSEVTILLPFQRGAR